MKNLRLITAVMLAGSVISAPAIAQERKTLFQVLFPKAHERKVERQRKLQEQRLATQASQLKKKLPVIQTSKNYDYKVAGRSPIVIPPQKLEFAAVESAVIGNPLVATDTKPRAVDANEPSHMTKDLHLAGKQGLSAEVNIAKAVSGHYAKNQSYVWLNDDGAWNAKARSVQRVLDSVADFGLRPQDYSAEVVTPVEGADAKQLAAHRIQKEIAFSVAVLRYAMDAKYGTIDPNKLSGYHDFPKRSGNAPAVFSEVMGPGLPAITLAGLNPDNEKFMALKAELAELSRAEEDVIVLPKKVLMKPGRDYQELYRFVAAMKKRASETLLEDHEDVLAEYSGDMRYSKALSEFVKAYQKEAGLGADGIIGPATSRQLTGLGSEQKRDRVILAMERLRWLPHKLGKRHVFINQPEYRARYIEGGAEKLSMRVVVGKKSNQTNFFYDQIEHVEYNPYWNVPRSIVVNEFAPKSVSNPGYLDSKGYEVATWGGKRISSSSVNWYDIGTRPKFSVRQPPGPKNALGKLKIMFPNKHAIYMHDTPAKSLFNRDSRAFSHGCVRLHDPQAMAAAVLGKNKRQINASIAKGNNHKEVLKSKVPVYVSYFTAWAQEDGSVKYFADMYGRDAHLLKAFEKTKQARSRGITS